MSSDRALRIPASRGGELTVEVVDDAARLGWRAADPEAARLEIDVPARALVAALRAAWADVHHATVLEPWRGDPFGDPDGWSPRFDDLGDGDPGGYRHPVVVPFPFPKPPPGPARGGLPWEPEEEAVIRTTWLAADPEADRDALLREVAAAVERGVGGVGIRLRQVGCDPARPGCLLDRPWISGGTG